MVVAVPGWQVGLILLTPGQRMGNVSIYVGDDSSSVLANAPCMSGLTLR